MSTVPLLTPREACALMQIGRDKLRQEIREKRIKVCRMGHRTVRIPRVEIDRWIERRAR